MSAKKKQAAQLAAATEASGYCLATSPTEVTLHRGLVCLIHGFLIFCAAFGSIAGLLNAFSIRYNISLFFFLMLALCFLLAFLHYNQTTFYVLYPLIFIGFTFSIIRNRMTANSGFQNFVTVLYDAYTDYFGLDSVRDVTVASTDMYQTVTVAAIYVGFVFALILNIVISSHMSVSGTILLTFPILLPGIYIDQYPHFIYFVPLVFSYLAIGILGRFKHFEIPKKKQERTTYSLKYKKQIHTHTYRLNGRVMLQTCLVFAVLSLIFLLVFYPIARRSVNSHTATNRIKSLTDEYVELFVQSGFSAFLNRYNNTGGLAEGRLGGVSSVRPDFETDLTVTFAPYSYDTVYLRAFVGETYSSSCWSSFRNQDAFLQDSNRNLTGAQQTDYQDFLSLREALCLSDYQDNGGTYGLSGKMDITNVGANADYTYMPYYTSDCSAKDLYSSTGILTGSSPLGIPITYSYYPMVSQLLTASSTLDPDAQDATEQFYCRLYENYCRSQYCQVPENLEVPLDEVIAEIGPTENALDAADKIAAYFNSHYTYSMTPGTTPYNADFIEYFLTRQNRGYCVHFASAGTMLLRRMGYPARYVEGYVINSADIANGENTALSYEDYLKGDSPIGETGVITVEVSDGNAHSWIEIYQEGFGWIPVEVTPPSGEDYTDTSDFWQVFSGLFSLASGATSSPNETQVPTEFTTGFTDFFDSTSHLSFPLIILLLLLLLYDPLRSGFHGLTEQLALRKARRECAYDLVAKYLYRQLFFKLLNKNIISVPSSFHNKGHKKGQRKRLTYRQKLSLWQSYVPDQLIPLWPVPEDMARYVSILEKALYSKNSISAEELAEFETLQRNFL
ncbi:MAG: transglutaminase family protein [Roseburia sp.]